uniref:Uncharacterized protein n=1 Tax=Cucumis melo TaxID=3656 RepID=A0A9I9CXN9_CUCME
MNKEYQTRTGQSLMDRVRASRRRATKHVGQNDEVGLGTRSKAWVGPLGARCGSRLGSGGMRDGPNRASWSFRVSLGFRVESRV